MPAGRGRRGGFKIPEEHRSKIANSQILNRLIKHAEGEVEMSATQVTAGLGLLKKVLPDITRDEHTGDGGGPILHRVTVRVVDPRGPTD